MAQPERYGRFGSYRRPAACGGQRARCVRVRLQSQRIHGGPDQGTCCDFATHQFLLQRRDERRLHSPGRKGVQRQLRLRPVDGCGQGLESGFQQQSRRPGVGSLDPGIHQPQGLHVQRQQRHRIPDHGAGRPAVAHWRTGGLSGERFRKRQLHQGRCQQGRAQRRPVAQPHHRAGRHRRVFAGLRRRHQDAVRGCQRRHVARIQCRYRRGVVRLRAEHDQFQPSGHAEPW